MTDLFEIDDPEVDEDFLQSIERSVLKLERRDLWGLPVCDFLPIRKECDEILTRLNAYEKSHRFNFPEFKKFRTRVDKEERRRWRFENRAMNRGPGNDC